LGFSPAYKSVTAFPKPAILPIVIEKYTGFVYLHAYDLPDQQYVRAETILRCSSAVERGCCRQQSWAHEGRPSGMRETVGVRSRVSTGENI
jgi:hypothetical protein